ncbi:hypothetical protein DCC79_13625 [bacterium]|nr:hypothetical protein [Chloroflexi bacterium CFX6]RIL08519.1 MAG: hypothetical protein DCC79_13625 [bacterium]
MFFKWPNIPPDSMTPERMAYADEVGEALPRAEIVEIQRRIVKLKLPDSDTVVEGDVTQSGFTLYLGGFDWVTFPPPPKVLQKFPEFMPLPQQVFRSDEDALEDELF